MKKKLGYSFFSIVLEILYLIAIFTACGKEANPPIPPSYESETDLENSDNVEEHTVIEQTVTNSEEAPSPVPCDQEPEEDCWKVARRMEENEKEAFLLGESEAEALETLLKDAEADAIRSELISPTPFGYAFVTLKDGTEEKVIFDYNWRTVIRERGGEDEKEQLTLTLEGQKALADLVKSLFGEDEGEMAHGRESDEGAVIGQYDSGREYGDLYKVGKRMRISERTEEEEAYAIFLTDDEESKVRAILEDHLDDLILTVGLDEPIMDYEINWQEEAYQDLAGGSTSLHFWKETKLLVISGYGLGSCLKAELTEEEHAALLSIADACFEN